MTLTELFSFSATEADALVRDLQSDTALASADEQLFFFHYEPLEVALKVTSSTPNPVMLGKYEKLVPQLGWKP
jgi:hypothetical protein